MPSPRTQVGSALRSSLALVLALVPLLLGTIDFCVAHSLPPGPLSGSLEVFTAAAHPFAPLHLEGAGVATCRHAWPARLHLIKSIGTKTLPVVAVLWPDSHRAFLITEPPQLSPGAHTCRGYRGPPARLA